MLRQAPTAITLGEGDLRDFKARAYRHRAKEREKHKLATKNCPNATEDGTHFGDQAKDQSRSQEPGEFLTKTFTSTLTIQTLRNNHVAFATRDPERVESPASFDPFSDTSLDIPSVSGTSEGNDIVLHAFSPENDSRERASLFSPPKHDDFHYGGFMESQSEGLLTNRSSSFAPEDTSTPPQHESLTRVRPTQRLPRSPLYLSQNASSSPERRPTSSLTPRVVSRVSNHNTPGLMFSQPARRSRRQPRSFRHQSNSFSYDSTERSSAVYDQEQASSDSTYDNDSRPQRTISLDEELGGAPLERSQSISAGSSSEESTAEADDCHLVLPQDAQEDPGKNFVFSSPQLPLPPPFLAVVRKLSGEQNSRTQETSPVGLLSTSSSEGGLEAGQTTTRPVSRETNRGQETPRSTSGRSFTPARVLERLRSAYRARSPVRGRCSAEQASPPSATKTHDETPCTPQTQLLGHAYHVYNDTMSPETQPQTPAQLPEARHQSRYHPSYTAPMDVGYPRRSARLNSSQPPFATPTRRGLGRSGSPLGIMTSGFQGLYGGRENGDEERNWVEGVRSDNPEVRLIGLRDARNDGRSLNETPEREDFRLGRQ